MLLLQFCRYKTTWFAPGRRKINGYESRNWNLSYQGISFRWFFFFSSANFGASLPGSPRRSVVPSHRPSIARRDASDGASERWNWQFFFVSWVADIVEANETNHFLYHGLAYELYIRHDGSSSYLRLVTPEWPLELGNDYDGIGIFWSDMSGWPHSFCFLESSVITLSANFTSVGWTKNQENLPRNRGFSSATIGGA